MINLVPPEIKQKKNLKSLSYVITSTYFLILSVLVLSWAGLATYNYTQKIYLGSQQEELDRLATEKNKDQSLQSQAAFVQNRLQNAATFQVGTDWEQILTKIAESSPVTTTLTSIKAASTDNKAPTITITGRSPDRRSVVLFKDKLATTKPFDGAAITALTDPTTAKDVSGKQLTGDFTFSISVSLGKK